MPFPTRASTLFLLCCSACSLALPPSATAEPALDPRLDQALDLASETHGAAAASQRRIDRHDDDARALLAEYQQLAQHIELLKADTRRLKAKVAAQGSRIEALDQQIAGVRAMSRELPALMSAMTDVLGDFIAADLPFLQQERGQRLQRLRDAQTRADLGDGERFRRLLEAYDIELEYARTLETWRGPLDAGSGADLGGAPRTVDFFRLGRSGLYYLSLDRSDGGVWDPARRQWTAASATTVRELTHAVAIANDRAAPQFLRLPLPAPIVAQAPIGAGAGAGAP